MKKRIWIPLIVLIPVSLIGLLGAGLLLVLYSPAVCKSAAQWGLSRLTHVPVSVARVEILTDPFRVEVDHLRFDLDPLNSEQTPEFKARPQPQNYFEIDALKLFWSYSGAFGKRILWIDHLGIDKARLQLGPKPQIPEFLNTPSQKSTPSFLHDLFSMLAFQKVRLKSAALADGTIVRRTQQQEATLSEIRCRYDLDSHLKGSLQVRIDDRAQRVGLPNGLVEFTAGFAPVQPNEQLLIEMRLAADRIHAKGTRFSENQGNIHATYWPKKNLLQLKSAELNGVARSVRSSKLQVLLPRPVGLRLNADVDLARQQLHQGKWDLTIDALGWLKGEIKGGWKDNLWADVALADAKLALEAVNALLSNNASNETDRLELGQEIGLQGLLKIHTKDNQYRLHGNLALALKDNPYSYKNDNIQINGTLSGRLNFSGLWPNGLDVKGRLESQSILLTSQSLNLPSLDIGCRFKGRYPEIQIEDLRVDIPSLTLPLSAGPLALTAVKLHADRAAVNLKTASVHLPVLRMESDRFAGIMAELKHSAAVTRVSVVTNASGLISDLNIAALLNDTAWRLKARESLQADVVFDAKQRVVQWQIWCDLNNLAFENPGGTIVVDNAGFTVTASGKLNNDNAALKGQLELKCEKGEILADRFYANFEENPLTFSTSVNYLFEEDNLTLSQGVLGVDGLGRIAFDLQRRLVDRNVKWDLLLALAPTDLRPLYQSGLKDPFQLEAPILAALDIQGRFQADADLSFDGQHWEINGRCRWRDGVVELPDKDIFLNGIQLDLPIWFVSKPRIQNIQKNSAMPGKLSIGNMKIPYLAEQPLLIDMEIRPNHLAIDQKIIFAAKESGLMRLWPVALEFNPVKGLQIDTRLDLDAWELDAGLSRWWPSQGPLVIDAELDALQLKNGALTSLGALRVNLFGGALRIDNPKVTKLFSATPLIGMNVLIQEMDLASLTGQTSFGRIDGVLDGRIDNLEIVNGQAQQFFTRLETVRKKGVPQKISVEAVESIARIGGGQSPFLGLAGKIATLFKRFDYRKIGVTASLENDMFTVNGLIREKGLEYLVKKRGLSGVDVVNSNPDNRIGFKDMVKRIQRVLSPHGGPVVQ